MHAQTSRGPGDLPALSPAVTPQDSGLEGDTPGWRGGRTTPLPPGRGSGRKVSLTPPPPIHSSDPRKARGRRQGEPLPTPGTPHGRGGGARSVPPPLPRPAPTRRSRRRPSPPGAALAAAAAPPTPSCSAPAGRSRRAGPTCPERPQLGPRPAPRPPPRGARAGGRRRSRAGRGRGGGSRRGTRGFLPLRGGGRAETGLPGAGWGEGDAAERLTAHLPGSTHFPNIRRVGPRRGTARTKAATTSQDSAPRTLPCRHRCRHLPAVHLPSPHPAMRLVRVLRLTPLQPALVRASVLSSHLLRALHLFPQRVPTEMKIESSKSKKPGTNHGRYFLSEEKIPPNKS